MAERIDRLTEDVQEIKGKLEHLSVSVDERFDAVDRRIDHLSTKFDDGFGRVDEGIREQREYTEFAFTRLEGQIAQVSTKMDDRFGHLERKLDAVLAARPARRRPKRGR
jgi:hypothetical protein